MKHSIQSLPEVDGQVCLPSQMHCLTYQSLYQVEHQQLPHYQSKLNIPPFYNPAHFHPTPVLPSSKPPLFQPHPSPVPPPPHNSSSKLLFSNNSNPAATVLTHTVSLSIKNQMQSSEKPSLSLCQPFQQLLLAQHPVREGLESCRHEKGVENEKKKKEGRWKREELEQWLQFILRYVVEYPYHDLKEELTEAHGEDSVYRAMRKWMQTRNGRQCELFTKSTLLQLHRQGIRNLGEWACSKLSKVPTPTLQSLCKQYQTLSHRSSRYMQSLHELTLSLSPAETD